VAAQKCPGKTPCRWRVAYKFRDVHRQYEGGHYTKQLVRRLDAAKPQGTNVMKPAISLIMTVDDGPSYVISYGVLCDCEYNEIQYFGNNDDGPFHICEIFSQLVFGHREIGKKKLQVELFLLSPYVSNKNLFVFLVKLTFYKSMIYFWVFQKIQLNTFDKILTTFYKFLLENCKDCL
jgi:hypothetical protein